MEPKVVAKFAEDQITMAKWARVGWKKRHQEGGYNLQSKPAGASVRAGESVK